MAKIVTLLFTLLFCWYSGFSQQWAKMKTPTSSNIFDVDFINDSTGFMCTLSGKIYKTSNWGVAWQEVYAGVNRQLNAIFFANKDTGYAVGQLGTIVKTTDGGANWILQTGSSVLLNKASFYGVYFTSATTGYACSAGSVAKTTNGADSWTLVNSAVITGFLKGIYFIDDLTGFVAGYNGLYQTTDAGATWSVVSAVPYLNKIEFVNDSIGYVSGDAGAVLKTTDGGATWTKIIATPAAASLTGISFINADTGYVCGYNFALKTINGGSSWTSETIMEENQLFSILFVNDSLGYLSGSGGALYKTAVAGGPMGLNAEADIDVCTSLNYSVALTPVIYGGVKPYKVYLNDSLVSNFKDSIKLAPVSFGNYSFRIDAIDANAVKVSDTLVINVYQSPLVNLGNDTVICSGDTIQLDAGNGSLYYFWDPTYEDTQTIAVTQPGIYVAWASNDFCNNTDTIVINACDTIVTSLLDHDNSLEIKLYPNPADDYLYIKTDAPENSSVSILNILGQPVPVEILQNGNLYQLSVRALNEGVYVLRLMNNNQTVMRKFIKN